MVKRIFDWVAAFGLVLVTSPLLLVVAGLIRRHDGGPAWFRQERVGYANSRFHCLKFRTMHLDAEAQLAAWQRTAAPQWQAYVANNFKLANDPRVTPVGRLLRRTSLDELPQLFNVLRGEMSLVGPRPLLARELPDYGEQAFAAYCRVRPGITGLWQVSGRSDTTFADRARLDQIYVATRSFGGDLRLLWRTLGVLLRRTGAY